METLILNDFLSIDFDLPMALISQHTTIGRFLEENSMNQNRKQKFLDKRGVHPPENMFDLMRVILNGENQ